MANYCSECGSQLPDGAKFCPVCGKAADLRPPQYTAQEAETRDQPGSEQRITPNITLGADGKYRWVYEMSLFKNPSMFLLIWKIFFFILAGIFVMMITVDLFGGNMSGESMLNYLKYFGIALLVMTGIVGISFLIYAAIMGGKYVVRFEMDENGVKHEQIPAQAKKARKIAAGAVLIGMAAGNRAAVTGGLAAANTERYTEFSKTRKVRFYPRRDVAKIRKRLSSNQVYAEKEDFAFVQGYILSRVPDEAKPAELRSRG